MHCASKQGDSDPRSGDPSFTRNKKEEARKGRQTDPINPIVDWDLKEKEGLENGKVSSRVVLFF